MKALKIVLLCFLFTLYSCIDDKPMSTGSANGSSDTTAEVKADTDTEAAASSSGSTTSYTVVGALNAQTGDITSEAVYSSITNKPDPSTYSSTISLFGVEGTGTLIDTTGASGVVVSSTGHLCNGYYGHGSSGSAVNGTANCYSVVDSYGDLPASPSNGDFAFVVDMGTLFQYVSSVGGQALAKWVPEQYARKIHSFLQDDTSTYYAYFSRTSADGDSLATLRSRGWDDSRTSGSATVSEEATGIRFETNASCSNAYLDFEIDAWDNDRILCIVEADANGNGTTSYYGNASLALRDFGGSKLFYSFISGATLNSGTFINAWNTDAGTGSATFSDFDTVYVIFDKSSASAKSYSIVPDHPGMPVTADYDDFGTETGADRIELTTNCQAGIDYQVRFLACMSLND